jgi:SAM-dependent methyltransferase
MGMTPVRTPTLIFDIMSAYQRSAALKAALKLDVFTAIAHDARTAAAVAEHCAASERGIRILCDFLTVIGLLAKSGGRYSLTADSAAFLIKGEPGYLGGTIDFIASPEFVRNFDELAPTIVRGTVPPQGNIAAEYEHPVWIQFARVMGPMMAPAARRIADLLKVGAAGPLQVLDVAAGHGIFGLTIAQCNVQAVITAVDWPGVLALASENADLMGVGTRFHTIPGDAFKVDYGRTYDIALLTNFLHHFDPRACTTLLRKVRDALRPGGQVMILEFVPNEDRVSPPVAASFSLTMLAGTPGGDAYTLAELRQMLKDADFTDVTAHALPSPETVVIASRLTA